MPPPPRRASRSRTPPRSKYTKGDRISVNGALHTVISDDGVHVQARRDKDGVLKTFQHTYDSISLA